MYSKMQVALLLSVLVQTKIHSLYQIIHYMNTRLENFALQLKGILPFVPEI